jgi:hypothetical protein
MPGAISADAVVEPAAVVVRKKPLKKEKVPETQPWLMPMLLVAGVAVLGFLAFIFLL